MAPHRPRHQFHGLPIASRQSMNSLGCDQGLIRRWRSFVTQPPGTDVGSGSGSGATRVHCLIHRKNHKLETSSTTVMNPPHGSPRSLGTSKQRRPDMLEARFGQLGGDHPIVLQRESKTRTHCTTQDDDDTAAQACCGEGMGPGGVRSGCSLACADTQGLPSPARRRSVCRSLQLPISALVVLAAECRLTRRAPGGNHDDRAG